MHLLNSYEQLHLDAEFSGFLAEKDQLIFCLNELLLQKSPLHDERPLCIIWADFQVVPKFSLRPFNYKLRPNVVYPV